MCRVQDVKTISITQGRIMHKSAHDPITWEWRNRFKVVPPWKHPSGYNMVNLRSH